MSLQSFALFVDKPAGITSFDVVRNIRNKYRHEVVTRRKRLSVGHTGTLDPFATGLLLVLVGEKAVRLTESLLGHDKTYEGTIQFGAQTTTGDPSGCVLMEKPLPPLELSKLNTLARSWTERPYDQIPPMYSAKRQNGVRLYELARKNETVARNPVRCSVKALRFKSLSHTGSLDFEITVSKGTFIRTFAEDFALSLETVGHLTRLRRTAIGPLRLAQNTEPTPLLELFPDLSQTVLKQTEWNRLQCGDPSIRRMILENIPQPDKRPWHLLVGAERQLYGLTHWNHGKWQFGPLFFQDTNAGNDTENLVKANDKDLYLKHQESSLNHCN